MTDAALEPAGDSGRAAPRRRQRLSGWARRHGWRLVIGSFAGLALLIGLFCLHTMHAAKERREAEQWHRHTLDVLLVAQAFRGLTFDVLRGERGYLLTSRADFLRPYFMARGRAPQVLAELARLTSDNPVQRRNVAAIQANLSSYLAVLDRTVGQERDGAHSAALATVRKGEGKVEYERLQAAIEALEDEERRLLIERRQALSETALRNEELGYAAAAIMILLLGASALAAAAALRAQRRAEAATSELLRLATIDELTGLPNRRLFLDRLKEETARAGREGSPLCLATIDVDHFKRINDNYGHPAGDAVLRQLATLIRERIRLGDAPGRLGGEEFGLLLPNTRPHQAQLVCDRLCAAVARQPMLLPHGGQIRVTISTGIAVLAVGDTPETLAQRSDAALYQAKNGGRNQVRLAA